MKILGAILVTPFVWVILCGVLFCVSNRREGDEHAIALMSAIIVLFMWGVYFLIGGR